MPIEISCLNCESVLRVADEHAGKSARCPQCAAINPIPIRADSHFELDGGPDFDSPDFETPSQHRFQSSPPNPYSAPSSDVRNRPTPIGDRLIRHRGATILALGIGSYVCCVLFGVGAIIMGKEDLRLMDEGIMDPSGRGLTQAGMNLGIIHLALIGLSILFATLIGFAGAL